MRWKTMPDNSQYCSQRFDREMRELIDDYELRVKIFKMIDEEIYEYHSESCNDCDYRRKYDQ